ncbi:hypothetical protein [Arthrobacter cheniae]|uniref:hypothetical protein n=1 Tax=Arthrobacter cheniae TaxID=1258888 RepID=UPI001F2EC49B|nr:hypothetical protein [Arthrobacter cheniae]
MQHPPALQLELTQLLADPSLAVSSGEPCLLRLAGTRKISLQLLEFGFKPGDSLTYSLRLLRSTLSCFHVFPHCLSLRS